MQTHCRFAHCENNKQKQNKPQQVKIANKKTEIIVLTKKENQRNNIHSNKTKRTETHC